MSFSGLTAVGSTQQKSAAINVTHLASLSAGDFVMVAVYKDNSSTNNGDQSEVSSISDSTGGSNTWVKAKEITNPATGAANGSCCSLWYTVLSANITQVTANFVASTTCRVISVYKTSIASGATVSVAGSWSGVHASSIICGTISGLPSGDYLSVVACASEQNTALSISGSLTPNTGAFTTGGGSSANMSGIMGARVLTGVTQDASGYSFAVNDGSAVFVMFQENAASTPVALAGKIRM